LRIESSTRSGSVSRSGGVDRRAAGTGFFVADEAAAPRIATAQPMAPATGLEALLALQAIEDPLFARKKAIRRGNGLLDALEAIKADLLVGRVSEGRLNQVMALIGQARDRNLPGLDAVLDDIELRARVELAKFGRFPA
jgi:hypothetical protein